MSRLTSRIRQTSALDNTYMVTVKAKNSFGVSGFIDVAIRVTNVVEVLTIAGPSDMPYAENDTGPVATYMRGRPQCGFAQVVG